MSSDVKSQEVNAIHKVVEQLEDLLGVNRGSAVVEMAKEMAKFDAVIQIDRYRFALEYKVQNYAAPIQHAVEGLQEVIRAQRDLIPLVASPFMGEVGAEICLKANVNWLDLSGNAYIVVPKKLRIIIKGNPSRFKRKGRPDDLFAPSSSRVIRWLLLNFNKPFIQRDIANDIGISESYVGRVLHRLEHDGQIARNREGKIRLFNPAVMLQSWRDVYDINRHKVIRGSMFARSGVELMRQLAEKLQKRSVPFAMTGLAGAWLYDQFAAFRVVSLYLRSMPSPELLREIGFKEDDKAANVWLILPNDMGVFDGEKIVDGVPAVHPMQVYLDLKSHAERAEEAAEHLVARNIQWTTNA